MVELFDKELDMPNRQSSKGNQLKFKRDNTWYKADYLGYEGLAEYTIAKLLAYSNLSGEEYADYNLDEITYNGQVYNACRSRDFTEGWQLITLERLFKLQYGKGLNSIIYSISDHEKRLETLVEEVQRATGIQDFGKYMCKVLAIDALFLNEDRHTHNIAVMMDGNDNYKLAPIFDNGAGLLSDTAMEYPLNQDIFTLIDKVKAKTFCDDFTEQLDIAERLYGRTMQFCFGRSEVTEIVMKADNYSDDVKERVIDVVMQMSRKYKYLFK